MLVEGCVLETKAVEKNKLVTLKIRGDKRQFHPSRHTVAVVCSRAPRCREFSALSLRILHWLRCEPSAAEFAAYGWNPPNGRMEPLSDAGGRGLCGNQAP